jgi:hypothetical protein
MALSAIPFGAASTRSYRQHVECMNTGYILGYVAIKSSKMLMNRKRMNCGTPVLKKCVESF